MNDEQRPTIYVVTVEQFYACNFSVIGAYLTEEEARETERRNVDVRIYAFRPGKRYPEQLEPAPAPSLY